MNESTWYVELQYPTKKNELEQPFLTSEGQWTWK